MECFPAGAHYLPAKTPCVHTAVEASGGHQASVVQGHSWRLALSKGTVQLLKPELAISVAPGSGGQGGTQVAGILHLHNCRDLGWLLACVLGEEILKGFRWLLSTKAFNSGAKGGELCNGSMEIVLATDLLSGDMC